MHLAQRRRRRLQYRDAAALFAFLGVALSGSVPVWALGLFVVAMGLSLTGRRVLDGRKGWSAAALLLMALVLFGLAFTGSIDLIVASVCFAVLVTAHRLVSEPSPTTNRQVLVSSLLLTAGGAALTGELWFGVCLLLFGTFACLHLGLETIEGPQEREIDLPVKPVMRQLSLGVLVALLGGLAFFIIFPRVSWNVAARRASPGVLGGVTGLSDRVRLGSGGTIKTSARVVARVVLNPDPGRDALDAYWPGRTFDVFDGREWRGSGVERKPQGSVFWSEANGSPLMYQRVELMAAYDSRTLIALGRPLTFSKAQATNAAGTTPISLIKVPGEEVRFGTPAVTYMYTATSALDGHEAANEESVDPKYLHLPPTLDPRVAALAKRWAGDEQAPEALARRFERTLTRGYTYTLEQGGEVTDPLADFLFERRAGHCEHFATALAVMLRLEGVPSRVVGGFFGGTRAGDAYLLRAGDAHAWVEAFVPGKGWIRLDATPDAGREGQPAAIMAALTSMYEELEAMWRSRVVDYSIQDQVGFIRSLVKPPRQTGGSVKAPSVAWRWWWALLPVALVVAGVLWRAEPRRSRAHRAQVLHDELRIAAAPLARGDEPLEELARRLSQEQHPAAAAVRGAVNRYLEARFGEGRPVDGAERKAMVAAVREAARGPEVEAMGRERPARAASSSA